MEFNCSVEYDKLAEMYDSYYCPTWPFDDNIQGLIDYLKTWSGGDNILEIGIGTGNVSGKLYLEGYHNITGIDASEKMTGKLKYKCPKAHLIIENLNDTQFWSYDWILMVGGILERVEDKIKYFQRMYEQANYETLVFVDINTDVKYEEHVDPTKDLSYEFFNEKRNMHVQCNYRQLTSSHHKGTFTYTKEDKKIYYNYSLWEITQDDMTNLMEKIGFTFVGIGKTENTGYYQDILVFEK